MELEYNEGFFVEVEPIDNAYGVYITLDDRLFDELRRCEAEKKVDVTVKYNDETKEFTLEEFLTLLGFK